jgi:uncharacterized membrane protein
MSMTTEQGGTPRARGGPAVARAPHDARHVRPPARQDAQSAANFLGWFSVGLGVAEIVAPQALSRLIGVSPTRKNRAVVQAMGVREVVKGVGILTHDRPRDWMWGRVAGDVLDLALLGRAMTTHSEKKERTASAIGAVLGVAAMDLLTAQALSAGPRITREPGEGGRTLVRRTVTVMKSPAEAFVFFSDFSNFPRFKRHLDSVAVLDESRSRWTASFGRGPAVEFDVEVTDRRENETLAWRSGEDAPVRMSGRLDFRPAPGDRGTEITMEMEYAPPLGLLGATVARLFREEPEQMISDELKRAKQLMEVGEITVSDATLERGMRPARPTEERYQGSAEPASPL